MNFRGKTGAGIFLGERLEGIPRRQRGAGNGNAHVVMTRFRRGGAPNAGDDHVVREAAGDEDDASGASGFKGADARLHGEPFGENDRVRQIICLCVVPGGDVAQAAFNGRGRRHGVGEAGKGFTVDTKRCLFGRAHVAWKPFHGDFAPGLREGFRQELKGRFFRSVRKSLAGADGVDV